MKKTFTLILFITIFLFKPFYSHAQAANVNDSLALVALYDSTGGPGWYSNSGWLASPVNNWFGISLDGNGRVVTIILTSNGLKGTIPSALGNLSNLVDLELGTNGLNGGIPLSLGNLSNLQFLDLSQNVQLAATIPSSFGGLKSLIRLDLSYTKLKGGIPAELGALTNLQSLNLVFNKLTDTIPAELGNCKSLKSLSLGYNQFSGSIPSSLGNLSMLASLYLHSSQLTGSIPSSFGLLTNLQSLDLGRNSLSGSIPASLGNLNKLGFIDLSYNQLSGNIPPSIGNLISLSNIFFDDNQLSGSIPLSVGNWVNLNAAFFENNQLSGSIPSSIGYLTKLVSFELQNNQLSGSIPSSLGNLTKLNDFNLSNNQLSGAIPASLGNLSSVYTIDFSYNQLSGNIPGSLGNLANLGHLYLNNNRLSGTISPSVVNIPYMNILYVNYNYLNFDGIEDIAVRDTLPHWNEYFYSPQYNIPLHFTKNKLSVSAGGTLSNNIYKWYKGDTLIATVSADSAYKPTTAGNYWVAVTNSIATQLTLYSDTIAITNAELPITYLSFTAQPTHSGNLLQWQTATEINSAYFNIQRSTDGVHFANIVQVNAAGNSNTVQSYQYTDALTGLNPVPPALFYRLQEADKDGDVTYSKIIKLDNNGAPQVTLSIFPNPVHEVLNVQLTGITGAATILVTDASGKTLQAQKVSAIDGQTISINTRSLAVGVYFVQVSNGKQSITQKFVKE